MTKPTDAHSTGVPLRGKLSLSITGPCSEFQALHPTRPRRRTSPMRAPIPRHATTARALSLFVLVGAIIDLGGHRALGRGPSRPNILLLFADDQRADTIAAWG